ncbi:8082_t:CDS:2 [Racocetra fulgida]|uniref:8082_t:CDS:1 n=1 Tax=Racocetra fulgida TaxID=60492 RepID=A0A9N9A3W6_9GLOM|nr:8082_t:CDS:2 [Racocetra fulgida]
MELKKLHMGTMAYNIESMDEVATQLAAAFGKAKASGPSATMTGKGRRDMSSRVRDIVLALALCHNVTPVIDPDSDAIAYQASSPDEIAIVMKDKVTGEIMFYQKGADVVMSKIVQYNDWLDEECDNMAREGLRTLVIARRRLSEDTYTEFQDRFNEAKVSITDRKAQEQSVVISLLEQDLELLGVTGVEDKLQDDVKNTLELLRNAGLKIWMLTGQ